MRCRSALSMGGILMNSWRPCKLPQFCCFFLPSFRFRRSHCRGFGEACAWRMNRGITEGLLSPHNAILCRALYAGSVEASFYETTLIERHQGAPDSTGSGRGTSARLRTAPDYLSMARFHGPLAAGKDLTLPSLRCTTANTNGVSFAF